MVQIVMDYTYTLTKKRGLVDPLMEQICVLHWDTFGGSGHGSKHVNLA